MTTTALGRGQVGEHRDSGNGRPAVTISVGLTTYNQARYLEATLESALAQTRLANEIVVVDDGSTDGTAALLEKYQDRVRVVRQPNAGVAAARNRVVNEASSDYVALLDGDDLWRPEKLACCEAALGANPDAVLLAHDIETLAADGIEVLQRGPMMRFLQLRGVEPAGHVDGWSLLLEQTFLWTSSQVVVRKTAYQEVGGSDSRFRISSDLDLYLKLAERFPLVLMPDVLTGWRQHDASASGAARDRDLNWSTERVGVLRHRARRAHPNQRHALRAAARRELAFRIGKIEEAQFLTGRWRTARDLLQIAARCGALSAALHAARVFVPYRLRTPHAQPLGSGR